MKILILSLVFLFSLTSFAQNTELGLASNALSQLALSPLSFSQSLVLDISQQVSGSKSYQVGVLSHYSLTSSTSSFKTVATATIHFTDSDWKNAIYLKPLFGWGRDTSGTFGSSGIVYGIQVGKRFMITDQLMYRPVVEFSRDSGNTAQIQVTLIGLSLFISAPQLF